jgi:hypothetical protein
MRKNNEKQETGKEKKANNREIRNMNMKNVRGIIRE